MQPVKQEFIHNPKKGIYGDCLRACIASVLEIPLVDVPHFFRNGENDLEAVEQEIDSFLADEGFTRLTFIFNVEDWKDIGQHMANNCTDMYYLLTVKTVEGVNHCVVAQNEEIVHDPRHEPIPFGPLDSMDTPHYLVEILVRRDQVAS